MPHSVQLLHNGDPVERPGLRGYPAAEAAAGRPSQPAPSLPVCQLPAVSRRHRLGVKRGLWQGNRSGYTFFEGSFPGSYARGERYNYDPRTQDARTCGTTASLCGIEKGCFEGDEGQIETGIRRDLMMHGVICGMAGFPMLSSGDEIGQLNDYRYHDDPDRREDSRNLHRSPFSWEKAALRGKKGSIQERLWSGLVQLEELRRNEACFGPEAWVTTWDSHNDHVLALVREWEWERLVCLFNFTGEEQEVWLDEMAGEFEDLLTGERGRCDRRTIAPYGCAFCKRTAAGQVSAGAAPYPKPNA